MHKRVYGIKTAGVIEEAVPSKGWSLLVLKDGVVQGTIRCHIPIMVLSNGETKYFDEVN